MKHGKASPVDYSAEDQLGPLHAYLLAQPRIVRIYNEQLQVVWSNRDGPDANAFEGDDVGRRPIERVFKGMQRAERIYTLPSVPGSQGQIEMQTWRVVAWPLEVADEILAVEETERVESPERDAERIRKLDQDIEDLLHNAVRFLDSGIGGDLLYLPNSNIQNNGESQQCTNPMFPSPRHSTGERCWESVAVELAGNGEGGALSELFRVCSDCRVLGFASPDPMARISENFNRLIALLRLKYQETLDVQYRLQQADKLAIMGELLASIAHEIKNPLGILIGRLDVIGLELETIPTAVLSEDLGTIRSQANRVRHIIDHLLRLARPEPPDLKSVQLNTVILDSLAMVRRTLSDKEITVESVLEQELPTIHADQIQMQQVLLNLILNARDAMEPGGTLRIESSSDLSKPGGVHVTVSDNGEGIPPEELAHLFSAFHTTKLSKGGTGLGLAVCRRILRAHNGRVEAESTVGEGTRMTLWFPASVNLT